MVICYPFFILDSRIKNELLLAYSSLTEFETRALGGRTAVDWTWVEKSVFSPNGQSITGSVCNDQ
jgi:hypothetical protein